MGVLVTFLLSRLTHVWLPVWFGDRERVDNEQARLADARNNAVEGIRVVPENFPDTRDW